MIMDGAVARIIPVRGALLLVASMLGACANGDTKPETARAPSPPPSLVITSAPVPIRSPRRDSTATAATRQAPATKSGRRSACKVFNVDGIEWRHVSGPCSNGYAHGSGEAKSADGQRHYRGNFARGRFQGEGRYDWGNGVIYAGQFVRGVKSGRGTIVYADHRSYSGEFKDGLYDGRGRYTDADGSVYEGEFRAGHFDGRGDYRWANGDSYAGEFRNDLMDGQGIYIRQNGERYEGRFRANARSGMGRYVWPNGDSYTGHFVDNQINGEGAYTYANGSTYTGVFRNDQQHAAAREATNPDVTERQGHEGISVSGPAVPIGAGSAGTSGVALPHTASDD